jgi:hypothetical protein
MDYMNMVFWPYLEHFVVVFVDNILICSSRKEKHEKHEDCFASNERYETVCKVIQGVNFGWRHFGTQSLIL